VYIGCSSESLLGSDLGNSPKPNGKPLKVKALWVKQ
jgi:hypothetical protein